MAWRVANSLLKLREQVNQLAPARSKRDDGTIGDERHQSTNSDHNPWVHDGDVGVVTAMDLTHDPRGGFDSYKFADMLKANHDKRLKYVISNSRIWNPSVSNTWRPYNGANPHDRHVHISVLPTKSLYDSTVPWDINVVADPDANPVDNRAKLRLGDTGDDVNYLQTLLGISVDGIFGPNTDKAVKSFQASHDLAVDGIVGSMTWDALIAHQSTQESDGWQKNIMATVFGGDDEVERSFYDEHRIGENELAVALPAKFDGDRPKVVVQNVITGKTATGSIEDLGPWNTNDRYWESNARPQAESGVDSRGRRTNLAGIDLSPALARAIGINGMGRVNWKFEG